MYRTVLLSQIFAIACLAADALPPAAEILDRYIEVTGGVAAYDKSKFVTLSGTVTGNGAAGSLDSYAASPGLKYQVVNFGNGAMEEGTDGVTAWQRAPETGPRLKQGIEKVLAIRNAKLHKEAHWRDYYTSAETAGLEEIKGRPCYKLILTPTEGPKETHFYDKATGLVARVTTIRPTPQGDAATEATFEDFRFEGSLKLPHRMTMRAPNLELRVEIEDADTATPIDAEKFELPADVKALLGAVPRAN